MSIFLQVLPLGAGPRSVRELARGAGARRAAGPEPSDRSEWWTSICSTCLHSVESDGQWTQWVNLCVPWVKIRTSGLPVSSRGRAGGGGAERPPVGAVEGRNGAKIDPLTAEPTPIQPRSDFFGALRGHSGDTWHQWLIFFKFRDPFDGVVWLRPIVGVEKCAKLTASAAYWFLPQDTNEYGITREGAFSMSWKCCFRIQGKASRWPLAACTASGEIFCAFRAPRNRNCAEREGEKGLGGRRRGIGPRVDADVNFVPTHRTVFANFWQLVKKFSKLCAGGRNVKHNNPCRKFW